MNEFAITTLNLILLNSFFLKENLTQLSLLNKCVNRCKFGRAQNVVIGSAKIILTK